MKRRLLKSPYGWRGIIPYLKSFSPKYREKVCKSNRDEKLFLYYDIQRLIREAIPTFGQRESKIKEFQYLFREAQSLKYPQDVDYFLDAMNHVKERIEAGKYPPFPKLFPSILARSLRRENLYYRKYVWNIEGNDLILEPGQDPVRQPFIEPKQFSSDWIKEKDYFLENTEGKIFSDEEIVFGESKKQITNQK